MQKYRRQIAYLYAYEHGEQLCTAGFVKAEERAGQCRIAVHLKGYCHPGEDAGELYIYFYRKTRQSAFRWVRWRAEWCIGMVRLHGGR